MSRTMRRVRPPRRAEAAGRTNRTGSMQWYANRRRQRNRNAAQRHALAALTDLQEKEANGEIATEDVIPEAVVASLIIEGCPQAQLDQAAKIAADALASASRNLAGSKAFQGEIIAEAIRMLSDQPIGRMSARGAIKTVPESRLRLVSPNLRRDANVTGLRAEDHRRNRRETRRDLRDDDKAENVRAGKSRRYSEKYGDYEF